MPKIKLSKKKWPIALAAVLLGGAVVAGFEIFPIHSDKNLVCRTNPDLWFTPTVTVDRKSLPADITTEKIADAFGSTVYFINPTNIPLIVNLGKGYLPFKTVSGDTYMCDALSKEGKCTSYLRADENWKAFYTPEITDAIRPGYIAGYNRPSHAEMPPMQYFETKALYGDKEILIKGNVTFPWNEKYDPKGTTSCEVPYISMGGP